MYFATKDLIKNFDAIVFRILGHFMIFGRSWLSAKYLFLCCQLNCIKWLIDYPETEPYQVVERTNLSDLVYSIERKKFDICNCQ